MDQLTLKIASYILKIRLKGKRLLLGRAAHNGHVRAQFVLKCMYKIGINYCPDFANGGDLAAGSNPKTV